MQMPDAVVLSPGSEIGSYLRRAGGDSQDANQARVPMARQHCNFAKVRPSARIALGL
jgi:hypothetical protein